MALRPTIDARAGDPDGRDRRLDGVLEQLGIQRLRGWQQARRAATGGGRIQAQDGMEVDRPALLELGHLGIGDADQPPQAGLAYADLAGQGPVEGDGCPAPQLRGQGVPSTWPSLS